MLKIQSLIRSSAFVCSKLLRHYKSGSSESSTCHSKKLVGLHQINKMNSHTSSAAIELKKDQDTNSVHLPCRSQNAALTMQLQPPFDNMEKHIVDIVEHGIGAASASRLVRENLYVKDNVLYVRDRGYSLQKNVHLIAFGKAALGMARAVDDVLGDHLVRGVAIVPNGTQQKVLKVQKKLAAENESRDERASFMQARHDSKIRVMEGAKNNFPDQDSMNAANEAKKMAQSLKENDLLLVMITGGGSALLSLPVPEITLEEKLAVVRSLSLSGANIIDLNSVRRHLSQLKGGKLAELAYPANVVTFVLSDVIGDPLEFIASGPTVISTSACSSHAIDILRHYNLLEQTPRNVISYLEGKSARESSVDEASGTKTYSSVTSLMDNHGASSTQMLSTSARGGAGAGENSYASLFAINANNKQRQSSLESMQNKVQNLIIGNNRIAIEGNVTIVTENIPYLSHFRLLTVLLRS